MEDSACDSSSSESQISNYEYPNIHYLFNNSPGHITNNQHTIKGSYRNSLTTNTTDKNIFETKDYSSKTEGYCEHCRRNFCNKYYLKRHKLEVHGIHSTSEKMSWKRLKLKEKHNLDNQRISLEHSVSSFVSSIKKEVPQSLNLTLKNPFHIESLHSNINNLTQEIVKHDRFWETSINNPLDTKVNSDINFSHYTKPKENLNMPCPYCYQLFNRSNLVLHHMMTSHADFIQDFMKFLTFSNESFDSQRNKTLLQNTLQPNILHLLYGQFINSSNPITDRVKCDVCFKDICNKYYLKLHKQRMHSNTYTQSDFKISSICGEDFYNSTNTLEDEYRFNARHDNLKRKENNISTEMSSSCSENSQKYENKIKVDDDPYNFFKTPINFSNLNNSLNEEKTHCLRNMNEENRSCKHDARELRKTEWINAFHESPLDLSFKGSVSAPYIINNNIYHGKIIANQSKSKKRKNSQTFIKKYSIFVNKLLKVSKLHQIKKHQKQNRIAFEVKEFIANVYPKHISNNNVSKTDYIFGKKYIDLPVTKVYKHKPFAFIIQPVV